MAKDRSKLIVFGTLEELVQPMWLLLNSGHNENASLISLIEEALLFWEEGWGCGNEIDNDNSQPPMSSSSAPTLQVFPTSFKACLSVNLATCPTLSKRNTLRKWPNFCFFCFFFTKSTSYFYMDIITKLIQHLMIIYMYWCTKRGILRVQIK